MSYSIEEIYERAKAVKLLILDVDGVLTDAGLYYSHDGDTMKAFNTRDGLGLTWMPKIGVELAIITGKSSEIVKQRAKTLKIDHIYQGALNKREPYEALLKKLHLTEQEVAYIGDDIIDWPVMKRVGLSIAVANAEAFIKEHADWVTEREGGKGAVRDVCDLLIKAKGKFDEFLHYYESL